MKNKQKRNGSEIMTEKFSDTEEGRKLMKAYFKNKLLTELQNLSFAAGQKAEQESFNEMFQKKEIKSMFKRSKSCFNPEHQNARAAALQTNSTLTRRKGNPESLPEGAVDKAESRRAALKGEKE